MTVLLEERKLFTNPRGPHSLVLRLSWELREALGEPVLPEALEWFVDMADRTYDADGALAAIDEAFGPRPRRTELMCVLGDLVDERYLEPTVDGFSITERGKTAASELTSTPTFKAIVSRYS